MIAEGLAIFACVNSTGCTETSRHYYNTNPQAQEIVKNSEKLVKRYVGPVVIETAGPILAFAAGATGTVRLHKYLSLQVSRERATLGFSMEF